ncbi:hypothetical protein Pcinc_011790 [Petrolisthes cinctipes]|uniref:Uncharacterized protein n=1 Tax=Petrolisthes cinctipes TaxID=88211 RepID=A0AAE1G0P0_PETCI|nr:hypothetical protein Pcinc_011790 [Petrolisthes cinctipes]
MLQTKVLQPSGETEVSSVTGTGLPVVPVMAVGKELRNRLAFLLPQWAGSLVLLHRRPLLWALLLQLVVPGVLLLMWMYLVVQRQHPLPGTTRKVPRVNVSPGKGNSDLHKIRGYDR